MMLNDEALTAAETAELLHIGRNRVYELAKSGQLPSYKIGRKILFSLKDLQAFLENTRRGDSTEPTSARGNIPHDSGSAPFGATPSEAAATYGTPASDIAVSASSTLPQDDTLGIAGFERESGSVIAGHGIAADLFVERLEIMGLPIRRRPCNSYRGLVELYCGTANAALVHL